MCRKSQECPLLGSSAAGPNDLLVITQQGPAISAMTRFRPLGAPALSPELVRGRQAQPSVRE
jgi:hypothetical protein